MWPTFRRTSPQGKPRRATSRAFPLERRAGPRGRASPRRPCRALWRRAPAGSNLVGPVEFVAAGFAAAARVDRGRADGIARDRVDLDVDALAWGLAAEGRPRRRF